MTHFVQRQSQYVLVVGGYHENHQFLLRDYLMGEHRRPVDDIIHAYDIDVSPFMHPNMPREVLLRLVRAVAFDTMYRVHKIIDLTAPLGADMQSRAWIILENSDILLVSDDHIEKTQRDGYVASNDDYVNSFFEERMKQLSQILSMPEDDIRKFGCEEIPS